MSEVVYITWCQGRYPRGGVLKRGRACDQLTRLRVQRESRPLASLAPTESYQWFWDNAVLSRRQLGSGERAQRADN